MKKALVLHENQLVRKVEVTEEKIKELGRSSNIRRLEKSLTRELVARYQVEFLKQGKGVPCECGCNTLIPLGVMALEVSSPLSPNPAQARKHYYYASIPCQRKGMSAMLELIKKHKRLGWDTLRLIEREPD